MTSIGNTISKEKRVRESNPELYLRYLKGEVKNIIKLYKNILEEERSGNKPEAVADKPETSENKVHRSTPPSTDDNGDIAKLFHYAEKLKHMFNIKIVYKNKKI